MLLLPFTNLYRLLLPTMPLSKTKREHFEHRLLEERARALRVLGRSVAERADDDEQGRSGDLTSMPLHSADLGTDTMNEELDASNATRVSRELAEIDAALERLYRTPDKFGVCEDTGRDIPMERLEIIPWARTCEEAEMRKAPAARKKTASKQGKKRR